MRFSKAMLSGCLILHLTRGRWKKRQQGPGAVGWVHLCTDRAPENLQPKSTRQTNLMSKELSLSSFGTGELGHKKVKSLVPPTKEWAQSCEKKSYLRNPSLQILSAEVSFQIPWIVKVFFPTLLVFLYTREFPNNEVSQLELKF